MSDKKELTLKQLALGLCGEYQDSKITSDDVWNVLHMLTSYICDGKLNVYSDGQPFLLYGSDWRTRELATPNETTWGEPNKSFPFHDRALQNPDRIDIRKEVFEKFLKHETLENNKKNKSAAEKVKQGEGEWVANGMESDSAKQDSNNAIEYGIFLADIRERYEKYRPFDANTASQHPEKETTGQPPGKPKKKETKRGRVKKKVLGIIRKHLKKNRDSNYNTMHGEIVKAKNPDLKNKNGEVFPTKHTSQNWITIEKELLNNP